MEGNIELTLLLGHASETTQSHIQHASVNHDIGQPHKYEVRSASHYTSCLPFLRTTRTHPCQGLRFHASIPITHQHVYQVRDQMSFLRGIIPDLRVGGM